MSSIADQVVEYVERNYAAQISLRDVAQAVGYSACHLTTEFRRARGLPVTAWIVKRRIIAAQELLSAYNMTVARTSAAVGFTDLCYFTRQFVRHVGMTPGRFRSATNKAVNDHMNGRTRMC
jgi:AraC-like DNA-binding protein